MMGKHIHSVIVANKKTYFSHKKKKVPLEVNINVVIINI